LAHAQQKSYNILVGVLLVLIIVSGIIGYLTGSSKVTTQTVTVTRTETVATSTTQSSTQTTLATSPTSTTAKYVLHVAVSSAPIPCDLNPYGECDPHNLLVKVFKEEVENATGGAVQVIIHTAGELGSESDYVEMLRSGDLFLSVMSPIVFVNYLPQLAWVNWPGLFRTLEQARDFAETDLAKEKLNVCGSIGLMCVMLSPGGTKVFYTVPDKPIRTPDDIKGLKLRTISPGVVKLYQSLGAIPTSLPLSEVYTALQTRTIDGGELEPAYILSSRIYEVAPNIALFPVYVQFHVTLISEKLFNSLPPDIQQIVLEAAINATKVKTEWYLKWESMAIENLKNKGANIIEPDSQALQKWYQILDKFLEDTKNQIDPDVYNWAKQYWTTHSS